MDSDLLVTKKNGKNIKDIIDTAGRDAFRRMERSTLKQICTKDRQVVATGGGGYNRDNLARAWTSVVRSFVNAA